LIPGGGIPILGPRCKMRNGADQTFLENHERAHHVVFLMFEDVAVPDVFVAAGPRTRRNCERHHREVELHKHRGHLARMHLHGFLPTVRLWTDCHSGRREDGGAACQFEVLTREHLNVDEVEVDRMCVRRVIEDTPDLRAFFYDKLSRRRLIPSIRISRP
jgi:hypothetical protein